MHPLGQVAVRRGPADDACGCGSATALELAEAAARLSPSRLARARGGARSWKPATARPRRRWAVWRASRCRCWVRLRLRRVVRRDLVDQPGVGPARDGPDLRHRRRFGGAVRDVSGADGAAGRAVRARLFATQQESQSSRREDDCRRQPTGGPGGCRRWPAGPGRSGRRGPGPSRGRLGIAAGLQVVLDLPRVRRGRRTADARRTGRGRVRHVQLRRRSAAALVVGYGAHHSTHGPGHSPRSPVGWAAT